MSQPNPVRIGNAEREAAVRELGEHYAEGRLDAHEYEERTAAAYAARTVDDLAPLFADLPGHAEPATVALPPPPAYPGAAPARDVDAPFGRDPETGIPYSHRNKVVAGVLQLVLPCGVGRFYTGHVGTGIAQLLLSPLGIGVVWCWIDGLAMLVMRHVYDPSGRILRP
ncbi:hypothetical protein BJF78_01230 [Pseudonocardia sp. CNS-139]|nr:hypothetical protein BJF78_01230 [Pseudonocardia sp. CNS-139]